ncbi:uncharacterized protein C8Q71DRAFT_33063 [Rhodofomes roseus]|uniref:HIG1 domain-containing protein n=1 Tax=Rhodofomes roseus TaxID=34475 RepID=A0ABQ8KYN6_9APHY|nr:uncharacterized protein C8Q71DRAFT_33063 [Rhodofomes roseus]KAH9844168.1 hypothetical protein C8Q71DRAFT_33063 [Rhodofomes roseus]
MKFATEEEIAAHNRATVRGAIEGTAAGLALSVPGSLYLHRRWPAYRALPIQLKVMFCIFVTAPLYAIQAERRGVQYDESTWTGAGKRELKRLETDEETRWNRLNTQEKFKDWAFRNQIKIVMGSWAAGMALAGGIIWRDRQQSATQKIVQVRMWAQGLAIGVLIAAAVLTQSNSKDAAEHRMVDHSWRGMVQEFEDEERAREKYRLMHPPTRTPSSSS